MIGFNTGLEGILLLSREEFDTIQKTENLLYIVHESEAFSLYLGNMPLILNSMKFYANLSELTCLQGDTLPAFHVDVENVSDFSCKIIIENDTDTIQKGCTADDTGFSVQLTSQDTADLSGTYRYHFYLTDSAGLQYRKLAGTLTVNPVAQGV